ncbi:MAG: hypothetical protein RLZZ15_3081 [Verrucomicrobiota bacterium]|jgi:hypothetical protein
MKRLALFLATATLLLGAAKELPPVVHTAEAAKSEIVVKARSKFTVLIPNPSDAPYQWSIISMNTKLVVSIGSPTPVPDAKTPSWSMTFQALRLGRAPVRFVWGPKPGGEATAPTVMREVLVTIE